MTYWIGNTLGKTYHRFRIPLLGLDTTLGVWAAHLPIIEHFEHNLVEEGP